MMKRYMINRLFALFVIMIMFLSIVVLLIR